MQSTLVRFDDYKTAKQYLDDLLFLKQSSPKWNEAYKGMTKYLDTLGLL